MPTIKNNLTKSIQKEDILGLMKYTNLVYRPHDPGQYLYRMVAQFPGKKKFSSQFIELAYTTLIAWNMNQRQAKLAEYSTFRDSLMDYKSEIQSLNNLKIEEDLDLGKLRKSINLLYQNLQLVADGKPRLVSFSKTLHYFLPQLLMPIDRSYTLKFFYNTTNIPQKEDRQIEMYIDIFEQFQSFAKSFNFYKHIDNLWNSNTPKIIDNIIIAYIKTKGGSIG